MQKLLDVDWNGSGLEFTGNSANGHKVAIDGKTLKGTSPMALMLHSVAACSAIDVVVILERMRLTIDSLKVEVEAQREEGEGARKWTHIHLRFILGGDIPTPKAERSIKLSVEKYCSAMRQLEGSAEITTELVQM